MKNTLKSVRSTISEYSEYKVSNRNGKITIRKEVSPAHANFERDMLSLILKQKGFQSTAEIIQLPRGLYMYFAVQAIIEV